MTTGSKQLIRDINTNLVLKTIISQQPISRADLSKHLGLTKATISSIVRDLIENNLVVETGNGSTHLGRKPVLLAYNTKAGYTIGINLGVETISIMLTNLGPQKIHLNSIEIPEINTTNVLNILIHLIDQVIEETQNSPYGVVGITVSIIGVVKDHKILFAPYYDLQDYPLAELLEKHYDIPVHILNEANLSALGERLFMFQSKNMANISIHDGVGLGLVIDHQLYDGFSGFAGEFGHTIIEIDGKPCPCGNLGCLEQYCSERALLKSLATLKNRKKISFDEYMILQKSNDPDAITITNDFIKYISAGINNLINVFNPEIVVINSQFTTAFPNLIEEIRHRLASKTNQFNKIMASVVEDQQSILYGCAYINIINFLGVKDFHPSSMTNYYSF